MIAKHKMHALPVLEREQDIQLFLLFLPLLLLVDSAREIPILNQKKNEPTNLGSEFGK